MSQILYKNLRIIPILLLCGLLWRCTSANPSGAVAPAPLAEVPSLQFPETVGGEFDVTPSAPSVSGAALKAFVNEGDDISGPIADSSDNAALVTDLMDQILGPLHTLVIPSREDVHTFEDVIVIGDQLVHVMPTTHEQLAHYVGTSREIITQHLNQFRRENLLRYSRQGLDVDPAALGRYLEGV